MPRSESSSVLIKLSRISAMIFVKQKNESASAFSEINHALNLKTAILKRFNHSQNFIILKRPLLITV